MSVERTPLTSSLAGEGGREQSERPGGGSFTPSPASLTFRRQVPIGPFIADFVCFEARLVLEVDGGQHAEVRR